MFPAGLFSGAAHRHTRNARKAKQAKAQNSCTDGTATSGQRTRYTPYEIPDLTASCYAGRFIYRQILHASFDNDPLFHSSHFLTVI
jgi:hypothetical protein